MGIKFGSISLEGCTVHTKYMNDDEVSSIKSNVESCSILRSDDPLVTDKQIITGVKKDTKQAA